MSDTVRIRVGWNDDYEQFWFDTCEPGDTDDELHCQEGDVPVELWARYSALRTEWASIEAEIVSHVDVVEGGHRRTPCESYQGAGERHVIPERWCITLTASGDPDVWPITPYYMHLTETADEAEQIIDQLPAEIWFWHSGPAPVRISRDRFAITHRPAIAYGDDCSRCGHGLDAHPGEYAGTGGEQ